MHGRVGSPAARRGAGREESGDEARTCPAAVAGTATAGDDGEVKFWKIADRTQLETKHPYRHDGVDLLQFSDDGMRCMTGSDDGWRRIDPRPAGMPFYSVSASTK